MANVIIDDTNLTNIANAIRGKNGTQNTYLPSEMATAITNIPSGGGGKYPWAENILDGWDVKYLETSVSSNTRNVSAIAGGTNYDDVVVFPYISNSYSGIKYYYFDATTNDVGDSILSHASYYESTGSGDYIASLGGVVAQASPWEPAPSINKSKLSSNYVKDFSSVSLNTYVYNSFKSDIQNDGGTLNEKLIFYNMNGIILAVYNSFSDAITALNSQTPPFDYSNGIAIASPFVFETSSNYPSVSGGRMLQYT